MQYNISKHNKLVVWEKILGYSSVIVLIIMKKKLLQQI